MPSNSIEFSQLASSEPKEQNRQEGKYSITALDSLTFDSACTQFPLVRRIIVKLSRGSSRALHSRVHCCFPRCVLILSVEKSGRERKHNMDSVPTTRISMRVTSLPDVSFLSEARGYYDLPVVVFVQVGDSLCRRLF